jgi:hypothetical protein
MPRHVKATANAIQRSRRDWYAFHYECRQKAMALDKDIIHAYLEAVKNLLPPVMTMFGGLLADYPERRAYEIAAVYGLDVNLLNPWYLTTEGWDEFQILWQQLPEPINLFKSKTVHTPGVQIGNLYTLYTLPDEVQPPG